MNELKSWGIQAFYFKASEASIHVSQADRSQLSSTFVMTREIDRPIAGGISDENQQYQQRQYHRGNYYV